ncbi:MAG TPA: multiheme c-type cytochrome, partial [Bacteroidota bacterium]|nr:multiheme c-type cytochrome [Bacteroidota bacterium]
MHYLRVAVCGIVGAVLLSFTASAQNKYTGSKFCAACHKAGKGGTSYAVWEKTAHAKAYQTLLGEEAKKIAKEKGLKAAPHEAPECLKCH